MQWLEEESPECKISFHNLDEVFFTEPHSCPCAAVAAGSTTLVVEKDGNQKGTHTRERESGKSVAIGLGMG